MRVQICSASNPSSTGRGAASIGRCLRLLTWRSAALRSPGQQRSSQAWRPQLNVTRQTRIHCGGSTMPWWQMVVEVVRPQRQLICTFRKHAEHSPA